MKIINRIKNVDKIAVRMSRKINDRAMARTNKAVRKLMRQLAVQSDLPMTGWGR